jgi:hypothetical protein
MPVGIFPKLPEERSSLLFRAKGEGDSHPELPGKGKERLRVGGQESFQSEHIRDY